VVEGRIPVAAKCSASADSSRSSWPPTRPSSFAGSQNRLAVLYSDSQVAKCSRWLPLVSSETPCDLRRAPYLAKEFPICWTCCFGWMAGESAVVQSSPSSRSAVFVLQACELHAARAFDCMELCHSASPDRPAGCLSACVASCGGEPRGVLSVLVSV
jgi:hypothetical protein